METVIPLTSPASTLFSISKALNCPISKTNPLLLARCLLHTRFPAHHRLLSPVVSLSTSASSSVKIFYASVLLSQLRRRLDCVSGSAASFGTGGGGGSGGVYGDGGDSGGGRGEGADGGDSMAKLGAGGADDLSAVSPDVIILDVAGMSCGGCAASVKRILESQPQVSSASVNLTTETAIVWPVSEAKSVLNWQKELGQTLATQLTTCGFKSNLRVAGEEAMD